jgi:hypothetical protein
VTVQVVVAVAGMQRDSSNSGAIIMVYRQVQKHFSARASLAGVRDS